MEVLHCGNVGVDLAGDISDGMKLGAITGHTGCRILIRTNDMKVVTQGFCWAKNPHWGHFKPFMLVVLTNNRTSLMKRGERGKI